MGPHKKQKPDVAKSRDPYSMWTFDAWGPIFETDVVFRVVTDLTLQNPGTPARCGPALFVAMHTRHLLHAQLMW